MDLAANIARQRELVDFLQQLKGTPEEKRDVAVALADCALALKAHFGDRSEWHDYFEGARVIAEHRTAPWSDMWVVGFILADDALELLSRMSGERGGRS